LQQAIGVEPVDFKRDGLRCQPFAFERSVMTMPKLLRSARGIHAHQHLGHPAIRFRRARWIVMMPKRVVVFPPAAFGFELGEQLE